MREQWLLGTTYPGKEQYMRYYSDNAQDWMYQYEYRTPKGKCFSCIAQSLTEARAKRDTWLKE